MTRARWYILLAVVVLALAASWTFNLNKGANGPQPPRAPIHLY
jgi:hypothetical protein